MQSFMQAAIEEAKQGLREGGIPIGAVLAQRNQILARGHNRRVQDNDPLAHAEIVCLRNAGRISSYEGTILYSTMMPCSMCAAAILYLGIQHLVVAESVTFVGARDALKAKGVEIIDLNLDECKQLIGQFIRDYPELYSEDSEGK